MNPAKFALQNRTFMVVLVILLIGTGILSYQKLGRLEDPTFTIKTAAVITRYPGATPQEVEEEVTDTIEEAIQSMGQVKEIYSTSQEGVSFVFVDMKDKFHHDQLAQIWDELRRKINDVQAYLPPGAGPSIVNDGYGDVYGVFFAVTGPGCSHAQLEDYAKSLKKDLLMCKDVAKIDLWGTRREVIYIEFKRAQLAELGLSPVHIFRTLQTQNAVQQSGQVDVDGEYMRITPTGDFTSEQEIADLLIGGAGGLVRLGDIAQISRGYQEPPRNMMRYNGQNAISLGLSTIEGGNVIEMGRSIKEKLKAIEANRPSAIQLNEIYYQSERVTESVNAFILNLVEAVVIVVVLLMIFMGWQSGLVIGAILLLTILTTFVGMLLMGINLQKVSLGALILALGMLVDNAIVVADGILVRVERGQSREQAAEQVVKDTRWPLLGATMVAILAFAAIGFAPGNVGEFCRSLFDVMAFSLTISWVLAVTIAPLFCVWFLKIPDTEANTDPYDKRMFRVYRLLLHNAIRHRWLTLTATILLICVAIVGFRYVPKAFFPDSTQPYFYINYWKPQGTHIAHTASDLEKVEEFVSRLDGVKSISSFIGEGTLRFVLSYDYQSPNTSYGQLLVRVKDYRLIDGLMEAAESYLHQNFPDSESYASKMPNGPSVAYKLEVRFSGLDHKTLQKLADQALVVIRQNPDTRDIRTDWRQMVRTIRPTFSESQARRAGVSRSDLSQALQWNFNGIAAGLYREGDELIPIISRPPKAERTSVQDLENVQVWNSLQGTFAPIGQVVTDIKAVWEWPLIKRRDRKRAITVQCNPATGLVDPLRETLRKPIEAISLPPGYTMTWAGEYKKSEEAQEPLRKIFPICILAMFIIVVGLFNSVRRPVIIFLTVPLSMIGVTAGLLAFRLPFGFMSILGFLGLSGMLIKNAIVLIDQIELDLKAGKSPYQAVLDSAVSRMRPVLMASGTTILGMAPLVTDPFYSGMAATIMSGLLAATFLTLVLVPVLYSLLYRIRPENKYL